MTGDALAMLTLTEEEIREELERERIFHEELERHSHLNKAVRRATQFEQAIRTARCLDARAKEIASRGGRAKTRDCPVVFAAVQVLLADHPGATTRELWDALAVRNGVYFDGASIKRYDPFDEAPTGTEIHLEDDGRLREDGGKSIHRRTFDGYATEVRKPRSK